MKGASWPSWLLGLLLVFLTRAAAAEQIILSQGESDDLEFSCTGQRAPSSVRAGELRQYPFGVDVLAELQRQQVDVWKISPGGIDIYITDDQANSLNNRISSNYTLLSRPIIPPPPLVDEDAAYEAREHLRGLRKGKKGNKNFNLTLLSHDFHEKFHTANNITRFMKSLVRTFPNHTQLMHIGHSYEGRKILGLKIVSPDPIPKGGKERKAFVIMGAQHAREWIATSTALYMAHALLVNPANQTAVDSRHAIRRLLDHFEFHIIPLPNPDGYEYTRKHDRLWYKNRQPVTAIKKGGHVCKGMDMNRNWGFQWLPATDPSSDPCGHWFPGSRPFEAHEVNALASYLTYRTGGPGHVAAFLDLRSYGQMLSAPYSYSCDDYPPDAEDQIEAALGAAQASSRVHGISISTGRLCETLYSAPGNIVDWAYGNSGIKYSYAAHLRDTGTYGFLIPEEWIRPTGEETAALVSYLATFIAKDPKTMR